jgi:ATP-binding cassette subfamily B protein
MRVWFTEGVELRQRLGLRVQRARRRVAIRVALVRLLGRAPVYLVGAVLVLTVAAGLLPVAFLLAGGELASRIDASQRGGEASFDAVYRIFVLLVGLFLAVEVLAPLQARLRWLLMRELDGVVRERAMVASLAGTDMTRLHDDDWQWAMGYLRAMVHYSASPGGAAAGLLGVARDYLTAVAAAVVLATFNAWLAVVALAVAMVVRVGWRRAEISIVDAWITGMGSFNESRYFVELGIGRGAAHEIRLFGLWDWLGGRIGRAGAAGWAPTWERRTKGMGVQSTLHLALVGATATAGLVWGARAATDGRLGVGDLVVFVAALFTALAAGRVFADDGAVEFGGRTMRPVQTIERLARGTLVEEAGRQTVPDTPAPHIELRDMWFRYPGSDDDVLRGVSMQIRAGTSAVLVGLNGAGKTTLIRLICGLYPPQRGAVLIDGVDLRELDLESWHRRIAPMFQDFLRIQTSLRENVQLGAAHVAGDAAALRAAADEAGVLGFGERLPAGFDTALAVTHADGADLSGGQWQRIGVARALYSMQSGARFLILDEPTSNLDTSSEERLVRRLIDETRGHATALLVTHRLALARRTDRIYVLEAGRIVQQGSHDELIAGGGPYASAFAMQASLYPLTEERDDRPR